MNGIAPGYYATDITLAPVVIQKLTSAFLIIFRQTVGRYSGFNGRSRIPRKSGIELVNGHLLVVDGGYLVR